MAGEVANPGYAGRQLLPLLAVNDPARIISWCNGQAVDQATFLATATRIAENLPSAPALANLCQDRYAFLLVFAAALIRGQKTLLPAAHVARSASEMLARHPGSYRISELGLEAPQASDVRLQHWLPDAASNVPTAIPAIPADQIAAVFHTSGSSGAPKTCARTWGSLAASAAGDLGMLRQRVGTGLNVVTTVPTQHMYGFELTVMAPLFGRIAVYSKRPLLPADVVKVLEQVPEPRMLVTTPVHLRALVASGMAFPPLSVVLSATAPLPAELAWASEARFGAPLIEVFGATETCQFASRRTAQDDAWTTYPGVSLEPHADGTSIRVPGQDDPAWLADIITLTADGFLLHGRHSDFLDMAGKRASLTDINRRLLAIKGVEDGVVFQLDTPDSLGVRRLAALVVAPTLSEGDVLGALRRELDSVFLPRPLRRVTRLPRNGTGKLPREALLMTLRATQRGSR